MSKTYEKYVFVERIDRFCEQKIDSILKNIESICFKDRRDRVDHVQSFLKIEKIERPRNKRSKDRIADPDSKCIKKVTMYHM